MDNLMRKTWRGLGWFFLVFGGLIFILGMPQLPGQHPEWVIFGLSMVATGDFIISTRNRKGEVIWQTFAQVTIAFGAALCTLAASPIMAAIILLSPVGIAWCVWSRIKNRIQGVMT